MDITRHLNLALRASPLRVRGNAPWTLRRKRRSVPGVWVSVAYLTLGGLPAGIGFSQIGTQVVTHDFDGNLTAQTTSANPAAPVILAQPMGALGQVGGTAVFSVKASGVPAPAYQWKFNGAAIPASSNPSAVKDTLAVSNLTAAGFGNYRVTVSNGAGSVDSQSVALQLDSVGDGIPDSWKARYFGVNWAMAANTAAEADFDGDGITNFQEYIDGTDPNNAASRFYRLTVGGGGEVTVQPAGTRFAPGTAVTLTAASIGETQFGVWTGDVSSSNNPLSLTMNRDYAVTPLFGSMPPQANVPYLTPPSFTQSIGGSTYVRTLAADHYGNILVAGRFDAAGYGDAVPQPGLTRLSPQGVPDRNLVVPATPVASSPFSIITSADAVAVQSDNKILVGGGFGIARLNYDGSLDNSFNAAITSQIEVDQVAARASDGKILVVGYLSSHGSNGIVRLNADGSEDTTFAASLGSVDQVVWQSDGKIIYRGNGQFGRVNADGSADSTYAPAFTGDVLAMALRADGELYIVSDGNLGDDPNAPVTERLLRADGSFDPAFNPPTNVQLDNPHSVAVLPDGGFVVDGGVYTDDGDGNEGYETLARFRPDGSLVTGLFSNLEYENDGYSTLALDSAGGLLVGGSFVAVNGVPHLNLFRVNLTDGSVDSAYTPEFSSQSSVSGIAVRPDGSAMVWGDFNVANGFYTSYLALLVGQGCVYGGFNGGIGVGPDGPVRAAIFQPDGKLVIAGEFRSVNGQPSTVGIARYNGYAGDLDTTFVDAITLTGLDTYYGPPRALALQSDGKILVGGDFRTVSNAAHQHIARLNSDGSLDTGFHPSASSSSTVNCITVQPDGKILVGGTFTQLNSVSAVALGRLNTDGTLDTTFNAANLDTLMSGVVYSLAVQPDGKILVGGFYRTNNLSVNSVPGAGFARLNADGTPDASFNAALAGQLDLPDAVRVKAVALQPDGCILVAGNFRLNGHPNLGSVIRVNPNGTLDTDFLAYGPPNAATAFGSEVDVNAVAVAGNGDVLLGGNFAQLGGQPRLAFTKLVATNNILPGDLSVQVSQTGVTMSLTPSASGALLRVAIEQSSDGGATFQLLGYASAVGDGSWSYHAGVPSGIVYYRALVTDFAQEQARSNAAGPFMGLPAVTSPLTATGYVGSPFQYTATAMPSPASFTASGLPAWASGTFDGSAGTLTISGTPATDGVSFVTLRPGNSSGTGSATLSLTVFNRFAGWAANNFTAAELRNPAISGPLGDATGAGIANLIKYALGIPPKRPGVAGLPTLGTTQVGGSRYLTLSYTHDKFATDTTLTVQVNPDLGAGNWMSGTRYTTELSRTDNGNGTETVITRDNTPITLALRRFIRLMVSSP